MPRGSLTSDTSELLAGDGAPPPALHWRWELRGPAQKATLTANVVVAVAFFIVIVWRLFFSGKASTAAEVAVDGAPPSDASSPCSSPRTSGVGEEGLGALPVYVHDASVGGGAKVECAVCICEFKDGDTGRLLPVCGHRFHAECVDRWLRSHATCSLCRAACGRRHLRRR